MTLDDIQECIPTSKQKRSQWQGSPLGVIKSLGKNGVAKFGENLARKILRDRGETDVDHDHRASKDLGGKRRREVKTATSGAGKKYWFNQIKFGPSIEATSWDDLVFVAISPNSIRVFLAPRSKKLKEGLTDNNYKEFHGPLNKLGPLGFEELDSLSI